MRRYIKTRYEEEQALFPTRIQQVGIAALGAFLALFPLVADGYLLYLANLIAITVIGAVGLNLLTGFTGQISLGHAAFLAIGAYGSAFCSTRLGWPFLASLLVGAALAAGVGLVAGLPALRLKGLYLAVATMALSFVVEFVLNRWEGVTGAGTGMSVAPPRLFGWTVAGDRGFYAILVPACALAVTAALNLSRTKVGRAYGAIRDRDMAAEACGIAVAAYKVQAFTVSSFYAGLAGGFYAHYLGYIAPENFTLLLSIQYLAMIIVGGMGTVLGSILGAIFMTLLPEVLISATTAASALVPALASQLVDLQLVAYGLVILLFLLYEPDGLHGRWERLKSYGRQWPFSY